MVSIGVGSILSGQGMARVKGATRDVYAAIRHARSVALVTGQRVLVNYSNETVDDETCVKIEVVAAKIMNADGDRPEPQPYYVMDYKELQPKAKAGEKYELVHIRKPGEGDNANPDSSGGGETLEEILFPSISEDVVRGICIKVAVGDESLETDPSEEKSKSKLSVFSNVDYLLGRFKEAKAQAAAEEKKNADEAEPAAVVDEVQEPVSVVWEVNGRCEPHRVWVYPQGSSPERGLSIKVDRFGAAKVLAAGEDD